MVCINPTGDWYGQYIGMPPCIMYRYARYGLKRERGKKKGPRTFPLLPPHLPAASHLVACPAAFPLPQPSSNPTASFSSRPPSPLLINRREPNPCHCRHRPALCCSPLPQPSSDSTALPQPTAGLAAVFPTQAAAHRSQSHAPLPHLTVLLSSRASLPLLSASPWQCTASGR
ncbi:hypothetical protein B296_00012231 [Ensete ventricosum]|uniref:Uncharacterized protein n=1 Tax=Ensete ventricosum TaxID=4639 RepID=A0A426Z540_ENSVE|nr:hypothetical protein B296_00012231 [Ensete ventricosum]